MNFIRQIKFSPLWLVIIYQLYLGILFVFVQPPFQKPDEYVHFQKTVAVSRGWFGCSPQDSPVVETPGYLNQFSSRVYRFGVQQNFEVKYPVEDMRRPLWAPEGARQSEVIPAADFCYLPTFPYTPQAVGVFAGLGLNLNEYGVFYLGRLAVFIFSLAWFWWLYRKINPAYRLILLFVFSLPMTLHQISAYSYDPVHLMLSLTMFTLFVKAVSKRELKLRDLGLLMVVSWLFQFAKLGGYEPMFLVPLVPVLFLKLKGPKWQFGLVSAIYILGFAAMYYWFKLGQVSGAFGAEVITRVSPIRQLTFLTEKPLRILTMFSETHQNTFEFYLKSGIGMLGWLDFSLTFISYLMFMAVFFWLLFRQSRQPSSLKLKPLAIGLIGAVTFITYLWIIFLFYLVYTPVGEAASFGAQGRYFLPLLSFGFLVLAQGIRYRRFNWALVILMGLFVLANLTKAVVGRYY